MDEAVRAELDHLLGYMRACRRVTQSIDAGEATPPTVPEPADYMRAMTWAQATGALMMLEHLRLITTPEREAWEQEAARLVKPPIRRGDAGAASGL